MREHKSVVNQFCPPHMVQLFSDDNLKLVVQTTNAQLVCDRLPSSLRVRVRSNFDRFIVMRIHVMRGCVSFKKLFLFFTLNFGNMSCSSDGDDIIDYCQYRGKQNMKYGGNIGRIHVQRKI